ncbi:YybH family protein [Sphingomonas hengshuiensis]|uniref:SnoaL-like domain-containing protein n=1 Tax=Sphingomonas hengshuiensis TaxID=1609977 RepID=A0A7U4J6X0_9SPHN|nr:nuclear transport factor 2 family protein [Sphingomonas hengshuiensis]AJP71373.1 hypothetical protein TS85_05640 [Sphingomonas hengshuiensis]
MTKEEWAENYIGAFNRGDFDAFTAFYAEDVVLQLGQKKTLVGKQAIRDFYTGVFAKVRETLTIEKIVLDETGLAAIVSTEFHGLADWPDFIAGPLVKGQSIFIESIVVYDIGPDGKFTAIRSARSKG